MGYLSVFCFFFYLCYLLSFYISMMLSYPLNVGVSKKTVAHLPLFTPTEKELDFPLFGPGQKLFCRESSVLDPLVQEILQPVADYSGRVINSHYIRGPPGSGKVPYAYFSLYNIE